MNLGALLTNDPFSGPPGTLPVLGGIVGGGEPSRYSQSPHLWNGLFRRLGIPGRFVAFDLPREELIPDFLAAILALPGFLDLTVTNPYKASAYKALKELGYPLELSPGVRDLGRLNHILPRIDGGGLRGLNTDGMGMLRALKEECSMEGARVLLVGAGDAAASIGYELARLGTDLFIANILPEEAHRLSAELEAFRPPWGRIASGGWEEIKTQAPKSQVIISAISAASPLVAEEIEALPRETVLADVRYGDMADFVLEARRAGRPCINGGQMLYGQFHLAAEALQELLGPSPEELATILEEIQQDFLQS